ncbi:uncharacterized protein METZ01_LOCUS346829, partial [marine metagenome]
MKLINKSIISIIILNLLIAIDQNPYLDIANELLVRKKLSKKLPDIFEEVKFEEITGKLDDIEHIELERRTHVRRLQSTNPEYHWCFASAYLLLGNNRKSLDHYRQYKVLRLNHTENTLHEVFQKDINELELAIETQQSNLAMEIQYYIQTSKHKGEYLNIPQIRDLQTKLNNYNELNASFNYLAIDGIIGPLPKAAIFDFEENNPYIYNPQTTISSLSSIPISSPRHILPVSRSIIESIDNSIVNSVKLNTKLIIDSEKIRSMPGSTIAEVLEYALGVNVKRQGMTDALSNISTFGGTGEQTLILLDGVK